jgi:uncharacterized membrane protein
MSKVIYKLGLIVAFAPLVVSFAVFPFLPETIPTHFTGATQDAWSGKWSTIGIMALFMLPVISLVLYGFLYLLDPTTHRIAYANGKPIDPKHWAILLLSVAVALLIIHIWIVGLMLSNI